MQSMNKECAFLMLSFDSWRVSAWQLPHPSINKLIHVPDGQRTGPACSDNNSCGSRQGYSQLESIASDRGHHRVFDGTAEPVTLIVPVRPEPVCIGSACLPTRFRPDPSLNSLSH